MDAMKFERKCSLNLIENKTKVYWNTMKSNGKSQRYWSSKIRWAHNIRRHTQDNADERGASGNGRDALQTGGDKTEAEGTQVMDNLLPFASYGSCLQLLLTNWPPRMTNRCFSGGVPIHDPCMWNGAIILKLQTSAVQTGCQQHHWLPRDLEKKVKLVVYY